MKKKLFVSIMTLVLCIPAFVFPGEELRKEGRYYIAEVTKEFKVSPSGDLIMEDIQGDVTITTWDKNLVKIFEIRKMEVYTKDEAEAALKETQSIYSQQGNTIRVGAGESYRSYMHSKFSINLPVKFNAAIGTKGGDISITELDGTATLKTSGGDIDLIRVNGKVNAKTSGGDVKIVKNTNDVDVKTSGGDVKILDVEGVVNAKTSGGDIIIQNNKAKVNAKTSGGDIELVNIGEQVDVATSGGDVKADGSAGDIEVSTSGGDVDLNNIAGVAIAKTSGGDIDGRNIRKGVDVKTSGGDIDLKDIQGYIEGATSGGNINAEMTLKDFSKDHHVDLKSSGGNITLWIPAKLPATIKAEIKLSGFSLRSKEYNIYSDFPLESVDEHVNGSERRENVIISKGGKINGGGDLIYLSTTNGNINIKKLK